MPRTLNDVSIMFYLPAPLKRKAQTAAHREGVTLSAWIRRAMKAQLKQEGTR